MATSKEDKKTPPSKWVAAEDQFKPLPAGPSSAKHVNIGAFFIQYRPEIRSYFRSIRATTTESYLKWIDIEPEPGDVRFGAFDRSLETFKKCGVKWQPFLICGPWYATPYWFRESGKSRFFKCLEHDRFTGTQSIWNKDFRETTRRFLGLVYEHYKAEDSAIDSILLGISGDYGEAIFPCVGNFDGQYHLHRGFWCNDPDAILDFRRHLKKSFRSIKKLNERWGTNYGSFGDVKPFLKKDAPSRRAMVDMVYWYRASMLEHAEFWIQEARKLWKTKDIYLCMGGDGSAEEGQHYTEAAKLCAKYGVGIRDTNSRDNFPFLHIYQCPTAVATNYYKTYCGFESSHGSTPKFIVARIFAFITSNAREFHEYNFSDKPKVVKMFRKFRKWMDIECHRNPRIAVFSSEPYINWNHEHATSWDIKAFPWGMPHKPHALLTSLRYHFDYDVVNDSLIRNGILSNYDLLIIPGFTIIEDDILKLFRRYAEDGKTVIIHGANELETVDEKQIELENCESSPDLNKLLTRLKELNFCVKTKKDAIFEVVDAKSGRILCYNERKDEIYWKRGKLRDGETHRHSCAKNS